MDPVDKTSCGRQLLTLHTETLEHKKIFTVYERNPKPNLAKKLDRAVVSVYSAQTRADGVRARNTCTQLILSHSLYDSHPLFTWEPPRRHNNYCTTDLSSFLQSVLWFSPPSVLSSCLFSHVGLFVFVVITLQITSLLVILDYPMAPRKDSYHKHKRSKRSRLLREKYKAIKNSSATCSNAVEEITDEAFDRLLASTR